MQCNAHVAEKRCCVCLPSSREIRRSPREAATKRARLSPGMEALTRFLSGRIFQRSVVANSECLRFHVPATKSIISSSNNHHHDNIKSPPPPKTIINNGAVGTVGGIVGSPPLPAGKTPRPARSRPAPCRRPGRGSRLSPERWSLQSPASTACACYRPRSGPGWWNIGHNRNTVGVEIGLSSVGGHEKGGRTRLFRRATTE